MLPAARSFLSSRTTMNKARDISMMMMMITRRMLSSLSSSTTIPTTTASCVQSKTRLPSPAFTSSSASLTSSSSASLTSPSSSPLLVFDRSVKQVQRDRTAMLPDWPQYEVLHDQAGLRCVMIININVMIINIK